MYVRWTSSYSVTIPIHTVLYEYTHKQHTPTDWPQPRIVAASYVGWWVGGSLSPNWISPKKKSKLLSTYLDTIILTEHRGLSMKHQVPLPVYLLGGARLPPVSIVQYMTPPSLPCWCTERLAPHTMKPDQDHQSERTQRGQALTLKSSKKVDLSY